ncbi:hypothetical protein CCYN49044_390007 [Capnocytophaga cynodegmi]|nr:hypothetical protein CCYN49044_390007 [Capnocytophaga cynodegmi]
MIRCHQAILKYMLNQQRKFFDKNSHNTRHNTYNSAQNQYELLISKVFGLPNQKFYKFSLFHFYKIEK